MQTIHLISLKNYPIQEQLFLEEALLRTTEQNWCIFNQGSPPAIVMGISGKVEKLVEGADPLVSSIPIIRRYTGGGTVIVDEDTLFVSFIFKKKMHPFPCYPKSLLLWSERLYKRALGLSQFHLRENDYVIGEKKCGGNAQYIQRDRCVHHTTFLWDFQPHLMQCLLYPEKTPKYRAGRSHFDFLCRMKSHLPDREALFEALKATLKGEFHLQDVPFREVSPFLSRDYRRGTHLVAHFKQ